MIQKFFTNTIESNYIKNLLNNSPIPKYPTVSENDIIVNNNIYIFKNNIIKCKKTGKIEKDLESNSYKNFDIIKPYNINNDLDLNITFSSNTAFYDKKTHRYLGKYLRVIRDLYGLDLMPFYNCFTSEISNNISFTEDTILNTQTKGFSTYLIPVIFNKEYTIFMETLNTISYRMVLCNDLGRIVDFRFKSDEVYKDEYLDVVHTCDYISYKQPLKIKTTCTDEKIIPFQNNLYVALQVPNTNKSSIVVIESDLGDSHIKYSSEIFEKFINDKEYSNVKLLSNLSLCQISNGNFYAFSPKLIEYLSGNAITHLDYIKKDILRIQEKLKIKNKYGLKHDVWDDLIKYITYANYTNTGFEPEWDITGYIDSEIEKYLYLR